MYDRAHIVLTILHLYARKTTKHQRSYLQVKAPYIPEVSSPTDTSNFDVDDNDVRQSDAQPPAHNPAFSGLHLPFVGFSFTKDSKLSDLGGLLNGALTVVDSSGAAAAAAATAEPIDGLTKTAYERRIQRLEDEVNTHDLEHMYL